ncbi:VCBS repeat-containing protein [Marinomonas agarivorans]|nr:VCBS repeat-containing protein [Marinomonas agarivorans]
MKSILLSASILCCVSANANQYLYEEYSNNFDHFPFPPLQNWAINNSDQYFADELFPGRGDVLVGIKAALISMIAQYDSGSWPTIEVNYNNNTMFSGLWTTGPVDKYVTGDYTGNGQAEILAMRPYGLSTTIQANTNGTPYFWQALQISGNETTTIDALLSGDFNGSGKDEVLLIQPSYGTAATMSLHQQPFAWQTINWISGGQISLWPIGVNDRYVVGDFNDDGQDELLAINANGTTATLRFVNNQWTILTNTAGGFLGQWNVTTPNTEYVVIDFDKDGKDEVIAINPHTGWSHILSMATSGIPQWQSVKDNDGTGLLAKDVKIGVGDIYLEFNHQLLKLNSNGQVALLKL